MIQLDKIREFIVGPPRDPLNPETRRHIALIAFLGWVGLGADGLSSSCYGPEESFIALGSHTHFGLYLALATAITVFIISIAYNQVIELFPSGGGGYRVATTLISPHAGLVSGAALIVDYVLTIAISIASGVDALFSLLPLSAQEFKLATEMAIVLCLIVLNMRGMKESIVFLLPIFIGFVTTHAALIFYGVLFHIDRLPSLIPDTINETHNLSHEMGWTFVVSTMLFAYSQGGGTYTGLEAVSNNVNMLAEPRVKTGKWTMLYIATSLAFTAGGIILLYLLWDVKPVEGQTLNAVTFKGILGGWQWFGMDMGHFSLITVLVLEAGLLFVASNTGFLGGPAVLANMAVDQWVPHQFSHLSGRLVTKNGVILMGLGALGILLLTRGKVAFLAVLYSINVFITFTLSLLGICIYWWNHRKTKDSWLWHFVISFMGLVVTTSILLTLLVEKFMEGGWVTTVITGIVIAICLLIKNHYAGVKKQLKEVDALFSTLKAAKSDFPPKLDPHKPTAVFMVAKNRGTGMHTLLSVERLFPGHFKNFVFLSVGEVDSKSYGGDKSLEQMQNKVDTLLSFYINFCNENNLAATSYHAYGTNPVEELVDLSEKVKKEYPNCVFFSSKLIFQHDNWFTNILHNQTAFALQRRLHLQGIPMLILPMKL